MSELINGLTLEEKARLEAVYKANIEGDESLLPPECRAINGETASTPQGSPTNQTEENNGTTANANPTTSATPARKR